MPNSSAVAIATALVKPRTCQFGVRSNTRSIGPARNQIDQDPAGDPRQPDAKRGAGRATAACSRSAAAGRSGRGPRRSPGARRSRAAAPTRAPAADWRRSRTRSAAPARRPPSAPAAACGRCRADNVQPVPPAQHERSTPPDPSAARPASAARSPAPRDAPATRRSAAPSACATGTPGCGPREDAQPEVARTEQRRLAGSTCGSVATGIVMSATAPTLAPTNPRGLTPTMVTGDAVDAGSSARPRRAAARTGAPNSRS